MPAPVVRDSDLPGPDLPAPVQSLQWLLHPPIQWILRLGARYGDTFRIRALAPSRPEDHTRRSVIPTTVVMVSRPEHIHEVFARSRDLRSGEASDFISWHSGADSLVVLDGPAHRAERQALQVGMRGVMLPRYEELTRAAVRASLAAWPDRGSIWLVPMVKRAALDAAIVCLLGPRDAGTLRKIRRLIDHGAVTTSLPPPLMMLPMLHADFGPLSPGGRVLRARDAWDRVVSDEAGRRGAVSDDETDLLDSIRKTSETEAAVLQRARTMLSALKTGAIAAVWLCYHVLRSPGVLQRLRAELDGGGTASGYLEAACKESLRLNPPFLGGIRRVAVPMTFGGIEWQQGSLVMPNVTLTHRRPDLFPEPDRFRPERFLERSFGPHEFAPFGGGIRRCLGEPVALRQMAIVLAELLRRFDIEPAGAWSGLEHRRHTMLLPRDPLRATVRRKAPVPA